MPDTGALVTLWVWNVAEASVVALGDLVGQRNRGNEVSYLGFVVEVGYSMGGTGRIGKCGYYFVSSKYQG